MGHVGQAQQVLRRLIIGRLTFTPHTDGYYAFSGKGTVQPLLGSVVRMLASPKGVPGSRANPYRVFGVVLLRAA